MKLALAAVLALTVAGPAYTQNVVTLPPPRVVPLGPSVGDIVLLKIDEAESIWRPVIVTFVFEDGRIDGELILRVDGDQFYDWPQTHLAELLNLRNRIVPVLHVVQGNEVGDWKIK